MRSTQLEPRGVSAANPGLGLGSGHRRQGTGRPDRADVERPPAAQRPQLVADPGDGHPDGRRQARLAQGARTIGEGHLHDTGAAARPLPRRPPRERR